jgi:shikimate dehydrogenase
MRAKAQRKQSERRRRVNDPEGTKRNIVEVATREFAQKGYGGARVDAIANRTRTSKRVTITTSARRRPCRYGGGAAMTGRALVGLIGTNIGGSLSPALHEDAFAAAGMAGHYHLMDVATLPGRRLEDLLAAVRTAGFAGVNITHPFKEAVIPLLDAVSSEAKEIGAVNTVVIDKAGRTTGHNTDRSGFRRAFLESLGAECVRDKPVLLLGGGGAGRAVAFALMDMGAARLEIHDRDPARAIALCADLAARFGPGRCALSSEPETAVASVAGIVNATPVGMQGYPGMPLSPRLIQPGQFVADVIYTPLETEFLRASRDKGARVMGGAGMCVHQAAEAFRLFTGLGPDLDRMHRTFAAAAARREGALAVTH